MAIQMDKTSIIVCSVIGSLGLLSGILGFSAEGTKLTPYTILYDDYDCIYPPNPAIGLGVCAAIFLLVAQVTFSAVSGCCGCCKSRSFPSETKKIVCILCAVFSWILAVVAIALFIDGASWNANVVRVDLAPYCPYLKDGIFAGAGVLALAATALALTSVILQRQKQPAAAATATAPAPTPTTGGQSPAPEVVIGRPLLPISGKPPTDYPAAKAEAYEQQPPQQVHPTDQSHLPQGYYYAHAAQNLQSAPPAAPAQANVSHAPPVHQLPPRPPAPAAVVVATAAATPALGAVAMGQPLPHVPLQSIPTVPVPQIGGVVELPGAGALHSAPLPAAGGGGSTLTNVIRNEVARQGVKFAAEMVKNSLFNNDNASGSGGDAVEATN